MEGRFPVKMFKHDTRIFPDGQRDKVEFVCPQL